MMHEHWDQSHRHFNGGIIREFGECTIMRNNFSGAVKAFRMSIVQDATNPRVWKNLALVYTRLGQSRETFKVWQQIQKRWPSDPDVQHMFHGNAAIQVRS